MLHLVIDYQVCSNAGEGRHHHDVRSAVLQFRWRTTRNSVSSHDWGDTIALLSRLSSLRCIRYRRLLRTRCLSRSQCEDSCGHKTEDYEAQYSHFKLNCCNDNINQLIVFYRFETHETFCEWTYKRLLASCALSATFHWRGRCGCRAIPGLWRHCLLETVTIKTSHCVITFVILYAYIISLRCTWIYTSDLPSLGTVDRLQM